MLELYLEEVDSTNKYSKEHIDELADKTIVYTYNQTAGRGRLNRKWCYTGKDNIYASIILKPDTVMRPVFSNLTQLLCLVLAYTFEEYKISPKIKWPNDIRVNGKKISGILAEGVIDSSGLLKGLILGFGVNLNADINTLNNINQPATSLNIETGLTIDKELFLKQLIKKFCLLYNKFIEEGFSLIREEYKSRAEFLNQSISVEVFDKIYEGTAIDVNSDGALMIVDKYNNKHTLLIGDIL